MRNLASTARQRIITEVKEYLDRKSAEAVLQGHEFAMPSVGKVADGIQENENNVRKNGFPEHFEANYQGVNWIKYKGIKIDLTAYLHQRCRELEND